MRLTKNEKKTLKMLIGNARITDSEIAHQLNISSQAVGKIRKKLEGTVINKYSVDINYAKIGIQTFVVAIGKLTSLGLDKGELEIEQVLLNNPHIINMYRIPRGAATHMLMFGFRNLNEVDSFFHSKDFFENINNFIEMNDLYTFSHNSLIKNSPEQLLYKIIDEHSIINGDKNSKEFEIGKRNVS